MYNITVTSKLAKKLLANCDLSKLWDLDCIPVLFFKKFESELSQKLAKHFRNQPLLVKDVVQYISEGILFSRLLEGLICGNGI